LPKSSQASRSKTELKPQTLTRSPHDRQTSNTRFDNNSSFVDEEWTKLIIHRKPDTLLLTKSNTGFLHLNTFYILAHRGLPAAVIEGASHQLLGARGKNGEQGPQPECLPSMQASDTDAIPLVL
jgi:hypothetical protein